MKEVFDWDLITQFFHFLIIGGNAIYDTWSILLDKQIETLSMELERANELLDTMKKKGVVPITDESVEALSPSAAAASRLLKSGMSLTQVQYKINTY